LATPVVWLVVHQLADRAAASAVDGAARGTRTLLRKVFRRRAAPVEVPALTREQLGEVRQQVLEVAVRRGLDDERATAIADALVARLALAAPATPVLEPASPDGPGPEPGDRA
jgi:hypothetical protein